MKRYQDLICKLLAWAEQKPDLTPELPPEIEGYTPEQVRYHVELCSEAGYLHIHTSKDGKKHAIRSLTWQGHEVLEKKRGQ